MRLLPPAFLSALYVSMVVPAWANSDTDQAVVYFETKIRPVLVEQCYKCHSDRAKSPKGGLRVDSRGALLKGGDSGPAVVPGKPDESLILKAMSYGSDVAEMPPDGKLSGQVLSDFRQWIASGAVDPRKESAGTTKPVAVDEDRARDFWAFKSPVRSAPPSVRDAAWARDEVDRFLLAALEGKGLHPVADADRHTWLRRVSLDLTGLPPTPEQISSFIDDTSPQAWERVVDRLLGSRAFGERWARHWLDLTGYADQIGTANDIFAEHAWRYRDYVIASFNADKPFDRFIREQIAGDLLPYKSAEERANNLVATGFLVLHDLTVVEADKEKLRVDVIDRQIDKVGKAFLGLTVSCARCHDHKFDPISQRDYYAIAGIFSSTESVTRAEWGVWSWPSVAQLPESALALADRQARLAKHQQAVAKQKADRERAEKRIAEINAQLQGKNSTSKPLEATERTSLEKERQELDALRGRLAKEIEHAEFFAPNPPVAFAVHDVSKPGNMRITIRGNAHALGDEVPRGFVKAVSRSVPSPSAPALPSTESGRRELADWLVGPDNPLTARVTVNRIWQKLFGEGLVRSVDYFGERGDRPTHPELLDALAVRFVEGGWSQKRLIRALVLSRAYGMNSASDSKAESVDPDNHLFWRMNRRRLDAETLRDASLAAAGTIIDQGGGPGLPLEYLENTGGLGKGGVNPPFFHLNRFRPQQEFVRTVYLPIIRSGRQTGPSEVRNVFDFTQPGEVAGQRSVTTVPTQALFLMNADFIKQRGLELAQSIITNGESDTARLDRLWLRVLSRPITSAERTDAVAFLSEVHKLDSKIDPASRELRVWAELCHALLASNEFLISL